jgi:acetylornithine/succinyldiaminopimelate/putrescine aminotransferase
VIARPRIVRALNDLLYAEDGRRYIDLFTAHGTVWLGHARAEIAQRIEAQLAAIWITGGLDTPAFDRARAAIEGCFPPSHGLAALYSTGMEAAEFALRLARVATRRAGAIGFANSMHGKSLATSHLGWDNRDGVRLPDVIRLPFLDSAGEDEILDRLRATLGQSAIGAVFVEPLQGCGGGRMATPAFYLEVERLCREHGALLVFDELLTGLHRTGSVFLHRELGVQPDVVLIGKALGNGFPVSAVVADRAIAITGAMLPGSTYAGNALACAAAGATLELMHALDVPARVRRIEDVMARVLAPIAEAGIALRGKGAIWFTELDSERAVERAVIESYTAGVCIGFTGRQIRLLPAATIEIEHLEHAAGVVTAAVLDAHRHARG